MASRRLSIPSRWHAARALRARTSRIAAVAFASARRAVTPWRGEWRRHALDGRARRRRSRPSRLAAGPGRRPAAQFTAVRYPGIDAVGHYYLRYAMPRAFGDVSDEERRQYGRVLEQYYTLSRRHRRPRDGVARSRRSAAGRVGVRDGAAQPGQARCSSGSSAIGSSAAARAGARRVPDGVRRRRSAEGASIAARWSTWRRRCCISSACRSRATWTASRAPTSSRTHSRNGGRSRSFRSYDADTSELSPAAGASILNVSLSIDPARSRRAMATCCLDKRCRDVSFAGHASETRLPTPFSFCRRCADAGQSWTPIAWAARSRALRTRFVERNRGIERSGAGGHPHARRVARQAPCRSGARADHRRSGADRRARHHAVSRRPDAVTPSGRSRSSGAPRSRSPSTTRRSCSWTTCCTRAGRSARRSTR